MEEGEMDTKPRTAEPASADRLAAGLRQGLPVTDRRLDLAGVSTAVLEAGDGPPVVLLHGQGGFAEMWGDVTRQLLETHRAIAPDLPGLGRSTVTTGTLDTPGIVAWLDQLIAQTCSEPPTLVGISLGGSVAAHYAVQHGDRLRRVVLIAPGSLGPFRPSPRALLALVRYMKNPTPETNDRFFSHVVSDFERVRAQMGDRRAAFQAYHIDRTRQPTVRAANRRLVRWSAKRIPAEKLRNVSVPVSLIWGRKDRIMRFRTGEKASVRFGWTLYPIDDAGHLILVDRPEAFMRALRSAMGDS
jgi:pimeloyl-ACP methyl ester carboxylesterase